MGLGRHNRREGRQAPLDGCKKGQVLNAFLSSPHVSFLRPFDLERLPWRHDHARRPLDVLCSPPGVLSVRLLLVEDDPRIALPTARALADAGHEVKVEPDGVRGLTQARSGGYDALLLDVMLPGLDGFELARTLRAEGAEVPIVFLTARGALHDRVDGLDLGGDAYLVKPFELPELLATLRAVVRRGEGVRSARVAFGGGTGLLDARHRQVWWQGQVVGFTAREYALLEVLVLSQGRWFTREELVTRVWGPDFGGEARVVDVYVSYLRRKLAADVLVSSRGLGYRVP